MSKLNSLMSEMSVLVVLSIVYVSFRTMKCPQKPIAARPPRQSFSQAVTPSPDGRVPDEPGSRGRVWGTDDKDYRWARNERSWLTEGNVRMMERLLPYFLDPS